MTIKLICAHDKNRIIGNQGKMPWHFPEDLRHFKETTLHHPIIMGRKTFESIGTALPERTNLVVTSNRNYHAEKCIICHSLEEAFSFVKNQDVFIIGGQMLFEQTLPLADELYLTEINDEFTGDAYFPEFDKQQYECTLLKEVQTPYSAKFFHYQKINT